MKGVKLVSALLIVFMFYLIPMRTEANWSLLGMALAGILMSSLFTSSVNWVTEENTSKL
tara:strand:- start:846 stop:1022 length:177 start_codon:yes stop_codon:yes gene_type:complete